MSPKERLIRSLTWEYFWQQKKEEIVDHFETYWEFYFWVSILMALFFQVGFITNYGESEPFCATLGIIGLCIFAFWGTIGLIAFIKIICEWITSNWERANKRAKRKIKDSSKSHKGVQKMIFKFELGDTVKDKFTGFKGHIESRAQHLNGCIQYLLQPKINKEGIIPEGCMIDEQNLILIKKFILNKDLEKKEKKESFTGGPMKRVSMYDK